MDNQELKAFSEFLKLAEAANKRKPSLTDTFGFKVATSIFVFASSVIGFRYFGDLLN